MALALGAIVAASATAAGFDRDRVRFEQNATDGDVEVVFEAKGNDEGLTKLRIVSPDGRTVVDFTAPDDSTLGIRQFEFESPEPPDVEALKAAYPEGSYRFEGTSAIGESLEGEATLRHQLPTPGKILRPGEATPEPDDVTIEWAPVEGVAGYIVEIEHDDLDVQIRARLPATASSFRVPEGFLQPGTEYELALGTVGPKGNISFVETSFSTAGQE
jgi:hypothetical protein